MTRKLKRRKSSVVQAADVVYPQLEEMFSELKRLEAEGLANRGQFFQLEAAALKFMKDHGITSYERGEYRGTAVRPMKDVIDWEGIQDQLGPELWERILTQPEPVPDKARLTALIELEEVAVEDVEPFFTEEPIKPHVKITRRA